jgi:hypothetical protein
MKMRRVFVITKNGQTEEAVFLDWGIDYEEFMDGLGSYSIAIVEYEDGTVGKVALQNMRFVNPSNPREDQ